jgi:hypothetical protein
MAHVCAHVDFFKHNYYFGKTNRKMIDGMANHAALVRRHMERQGQDVVEDFIDTCLSLENLIDPMSPYIQRQREAKADDDTDDDVPRLRAKQYMDKFINPPEYLEAQRKKKEEERKKAARRFPEEPQRDVLAFLLAHAPLQPWQRDVLEVVRNEAYYFAPQAMTKIMNEGWATYWHSKIMTERAATTAEIIDYADACSGVLATAPGRLNPYKLGVELYRHIEQRWNKGQFGKEWDECDRLDVKRDWESPARPGPAQDLRGAAAAQRHHVPRRVLHLRLLRRAEVLQLRLERQGVDLRDPDPRVRQGQGAALALADQPRPAVHLRRGRQPRQQGRAAVAPTATTASTSTWARPRTRSRRWPRCGPGRSTC